ncbi:MAG: ROK family transcriptional regulator [Thermoleophilaceae bacterium]|nr:ROK family transcriptional regulator [Thermoleophilaceae bacterium]
MREEDSGSLRSLRESNRERVVQALRVLGVASRAEVARWTGLSRSTVSSIVTELLAAGIVVDRADDGRSSSAGRPPALIALDPAAGIAVGVDFGKRHLAVAAADLSHRILAEEWVEIPEDYQAEEGIDQAADLVETVLADSEADSERVLGVGMGLPGPVHRSGVVGSSAILPGWAGMPWAERLAERLGLRVWLGNDANLGALAEGTWGAGRGTGAFVYLKLATGIGAGIVIDGKLFEGAGGTAGEIGHTTLDETGEICRCGGRGCLETYAAGAAIARMLSHSRGEDLDVDMVLSRAAAGDPACRRALLEAGRHIGVAVANLCNLVNPERIVVGGSMGYAGDLLLDPLRESVGLRAIPSAAEDVEIVPGELGERAELLGAVALVLHDAGPAWSGRAPAMQQAATAETKTSRARVRS